MRLVAHAQHKFGKCPNFAVCNSTAGAEHQRAADGTKAERLAGATNSAAGCVASAVMPVKVGHHPEPRQVFALYGGLPPTHTRRPGTGLHRPAIGEGFPVNIRIAKKSISSGGKLGAG